MDAVFNWKRRALIAEQRLRDAGLHVTVEEWGDDEYLVATLQHKDVSRPVHVDDLAAARRRVLQATTGVTI